MCVGSIVLQLEGCELSYTQDCTHEFLRSIGCFLFPAWFLLPDSTNSISKPSLTVYGHVSLCQGNSESGSLGGTRAKFSALPGSALRVTLGTHTPEVTLFLFVCWLYHAAFRVLIPPAGIEPMLPALGVWSHNRSTTRKVPEVALASLFSIILPSPPKDLVLWAHTEPECLLRGLLLGPVSYLRKMSPKSQLYRGIY